MVLRDRMWSVAEELGDAVHLGYGQKTKVVMTEDDSKTGPAW